MKKFFIALSCFIVCAGSLKAQSNFDSQEYKTSLGVKFYPGAITGKHFLNDKAAVEGLLYFNSYTTRITGLYEAHYDIQNAPGLKWYVGAGGHLGLYQHKYGGGAAIGIDGILGLDYKIKGAPLNLSLDWQPAFEFGNRYGNGFSGNWGGLSVRYVF